MNYSGDQLLARLRDYNNYPETESEYLDGRYFGLVLGHFPGVNVKPMKIEFLNFIEYDVPEGSFDNVMRLLISSIVPENSNYDIDYNEVHVPYKGMCNAYNIKEVLDRITKE